MRTHRQGSSELCFPHKGKKPGEREGKKNPYTTVLHYWVGQNPTNREELEEEGEVKAGRTRHRQKQHVQGPVSGSTHLGVKSTLLAVTAGPHTVQSVSRFHTFTRTIAIVK